MTLNSHSFSAANAIDSGVFSSKAYATSSMTRTSRSHSHQPGSSLPVYDFKPTRKRIRMYDEKCSPISSLQQLIRLRYYHAGREPFFMGVSYGGFFFKRPQTSVCTPGVETYCFLLYGPAHTSKANNWIKCTERYAAKEVALKPPEAFIPAIRCRQTTSRMKRQAG